MRKLAGHLQKLHKISSKLSWPDMIAQVPSPPYNSLLPILKQYEPNKKNLVSRVEVEIKNHVRGAHEALDFRGANWNGGKWEWEGNEGQLVFPTHLNKGSTKKVKLRIDDWDRKFPGNQWFSSSHY